MFRQTSVENKRHKKYEEVFNRNRNGAHAQHECRRCSTETSPHAPYGAKTKDAIEAFSDTTATADANDAEDDQYVSRHHHSSFTVSGFPDDFFDNFDGKDIAGMFFVLLIILIIFLFAPIGIIIAIFYFVNKNRREKYRLAQNDYQAGIRQMFTGVGLAIFLGIAAGKIGFSIGALVFFIGLGKWFVARQAGATGNRSRNDNNSNNFNHNNSNIQNYD